MPALRILNCGLELTFSDVTGDSFRINDNVDVQTITADYILSPSFEWFSDEGVAQSRGVPGFEPTRFK